MAGGFWPPTAIPLIPGDLLDLAGSDNVQAFRLDVSDLDAISALAGELAGESIDVFLSNAGAVRAEAGSGRNRTCGSHSAISTTASFARCSPSTRWRRSNARKPSWSRSPAASSASSLRLSSIEGSISQAQRDLYAYRPSKAALNMVTRLLSGDLAARGITVVSICPGWVKTRMGGEFAKLELTPAIANFRALVARLTLDDSGSFIESPGNPLQY